MATPLPEITVLIVDDDTEVRAMYGMYLTHAGCKVRTAADGLAAIAEAHTHRPDVIVMDLVMPKLDGYSASRRLKSSPATAHIPIIALSGLPTAREDARAVGCDGFLAKPCLLDLLLWEIRAVLNPQP
jgi:CheY-like chemotaxis protein